MTNLEAVAVRLAGAWIAAARELDAGTLTVERYQTRCETILALAESSGVSQGCFGGLMWTMIHAGLQS